MNRIKKFLFDENGIYRIVFSVCIVVMAIVTVVITDSNPNENAEVSHESVETNKRYEFTDEEVKKVIDSLKTDATDIETSSSANDSENTTTAIKKQYSFVQPVYGTLAKSFSINEPLYSSTLDDWRIHRGIDIACPLDSEVTSSEEGLVTEIGHDINLGNYVVVKSGDYTCKYASLSTDIKVYEGQYIYKGQAISYVSDSCVSEICDDIHLHFEMTYNGDYVDPCIYMTVGQ